MEHARYYLLNLWGGVYLRFNKRFVFLQVFLINYLVS